MRVSEYEHADLYKKGLNNLRERRVNFPHFSKIYEHKRK